MSLYSPSVSSLVHYSSRGECCFNVFIYVTTHDHSTNGFVFYSSLIKFKVIDFAPTTIFSHWILSDNSLCCCSSVVSLTKSEFNIISFHLGVLQSYITDIYNFGRTTHYLYQQPPGGIWEFASVHINISLTPVLPGYKI